MNCISCNKVMMDGKYVCSTNDYRIVDSNDNLVFVVQTHDISSDSDEIDSSGSIKYCSCGYFCNE